jgi:site-specific recombinase XerD
MSENATQPEASPTTEMQTVGSSRKGRLKNKAYRSREHLTSAEVETLVASAKTNRHGARDSLMILMTYRHGLRVSELIGLQWSQVDFDHQVLHVSRIKGSKASTQPLQGDTLRALRKLRRENPHALFVFLSERGAPFSRDGVAKMVARMGVDAGFTFPIHSHMLRHSTGYKLANDGRDTRTIQDYLGHVNIQHTVRYTELSPTKFRGLWK